MNLCAPVRVALGKMGVSTVIVINAINGVLGQATLDKRGELKAGRTTKGSESKPSVYKVTESGNVWTTPACVVTRFDTWHGKIEAANKYSPFDCVSIPEEFEAWLIKLKSSMPVGNEAPATAPATAPV